MMCAASPAHSLVSPDVIEGNSVVISGNAKQYLTVHVANQLLGLAITDIQDVIETMPLTSVPLAPPEIAGIMNLRGRIVTAIHLDRMLGLPAPADNATTQTVVFEQNGELYSLIIHKVGDVMTLADDNLDDTPPTLDAVWRELSTGIFRLENRLLIILDLDRVLHKLKPGLANSADA